MNKICIMFLKRNNKIRIDYKTDIRDFSTDEKSLFEFVQPYTMTSPERIKALSDAIKYLTENNVQGAFVECGVWKGGSILAMIKVLYDLKNTDREIYLFDTFEGMSEPTDFDIDYTGIKAIDKLRNENQDKSWIWAKSHKDEVEKTISLIPYPKNKIHFIKGKVEDTLKNNKPSCIALLRLDTDWYESTKIELYELYDLVVPKGVIIIDDYGHWTGCKKAVDEFFLNRNERIFLHRIDYTGRLLIK